MMPTFVSQNKLTERRSGLIAAVSGGKICYSDMFLSSSEGGSAMVHQQLVNYSTVNNTVIIMKGVLFSFFHFLESKLNSLSHVS